MPLKLKNLIHPDLSAVIDLVYRPNGYDCSTPIEEAESAEYGAFALSLNGQNVRFRAAKTTPTKIGQFVTLWKRIGKGPIQPFDQSDPIDFFVISTRSGGSFGHFVFPKSVLVKRSFVAKNGIGGKRAMRVYPPWDKPTSQQALRTQEWQVEYFLDLSRDLPSLNKVRSLYQKSVAD